MAVQVSLLTVVIAVFGVYGAMQMWREYGGSTFAWHPTLLTCGFGGLGLAGVSMKQSKVSTLVHGVVNTCAAACIVYGAWVIYVLKEDGGRPHFWSLSVASWHALVGGIAVAGVGLQAALSWFTIYPHAASRADAANHKTMGIANLVLGAVALVTGWWKPYADDGAAMAILAGSLVVILVLLFTSLGDALRSTVVLSV